MKRLIVLLCLLFLFSVNAHAADLSDSFYADMINEADNYVQDMLNDLGISEGGFEEILNISFSKIIDLFLSVCKNEMYKPLSVAVKVFTLMILMMMVKSFFNSGDSMSSFLSAICIAVLSVVLVVPIVNSTSGILSACTATVNYMKTLIPSLASIITVAGKPSLALCFQGACFIAAQIGSEIFGTSISAFSSVYTAMSVCGSLSDIMNTTKLAQLMKKGIIFMMSLFASVFSAMLTAKSIIATTSDSVIMKGLKFVVGNAVPVVGGALSETLNSVLSSLHLLKSTMGILAIIILVLINLPSLVEILMWSIALKLLSAAAGIFDLNKESILFESFEGLFSVLSAVTIYQMFLYIISVAMVIIIASIR